MNIKPGDVLIPHETSQWAPGCIGRPLMVISVKRHDVGVLCVDGPPHGEGFELMSHTSHMNVRMDNAENCTVISAPAR